MKATAKRRRSKAQIKADKKEEEQRKEEIQQKLLAWDSQEAALETATAENKQLTEINAVVGQLVEDGVIKQTGERSFEAVVDPLEREHIQSKRKSQQSEVEYPNVTVRQAYQDPEAMDIRHEDPDVDLNIE